MFDLCKGDFPTENMFFGLKKIKWTKKEETKKNEFHMNLEKKNPTVIFQKESCCFLNII